MTSLAGGVDTPKRENEIRPLLHTTYRSAQKCIKVLSMRLNYKVANKNKGRKLHDAGLDNDFLDLTPKARVRTKIGNIKLKSQWILMKLVEETSRDGRSL